MASRTIYARSPGIAETFVGALVGISRNGLRVPFNHLRDAREAWLTLAADLCDQIDSLALDLRAGLTPDEVQATLERTRSTDADLRTARAALQSAETSPRFNCFAWSQRRQLSRYSRALDLFEQTAVPLRGIAQILADLTIAPAPSSDEPAACPDWLRPTALGTHLGRLVVAIESLMSAFCDLVEDEHAGAQIADARAAVETARRATLAAIQEHAPTLPPAGQIALDALLADLDCTIEDLSGAAAALATRSKG